MNNIFTKIFGNPIFVAPLPVKESLEKRFNEILNVEWNKSGDLFEAIFYKDHLEYIALLNKEGDLIEYKMSLPQGFLPNHIQQKLSQNGEIMNSVFINKGNSVSYEIIIRDNELKRSIYLLNETGAILEMRAL